MSLVADRQLDRVRGRERTRKLSAALEALWIGRGVNPVEVSEQPFEPRLGSVVALQRRARLEGQDPPAPPQGGRYAFDQKRLQQRRRRKLGSKLSEERRESIALRQRLARAHVLGEDAVPARVARRAGGPR